MSSTRDIVQIISYRTPIYCGLKKEIPLDRAQNESKTAAGLGFMGCLASSPFAFDLALGSGNPPLAITGLALTLCCGIVMCGEAYAARKAFIKASAANHSTTSGPAHQTMEQEIEATRVHRAN